MLCQYLSLIKCTTALLIRRSQTCIRSEAVLCVLVVNAHTRSGRSCRSPCDPSASAHFAFSAAVSLCSRAPALDQLGAGVECGKVCKGSARLPAGQPLGEFLLPVGQQRGRRQEQDARLLALGDLRRRVRWIRTLGGSVPCFFDVQ